MTALNAPAVAAVVRRLDGLALAIELAAARVAALTPAELVRRLERSFAVLAAGRRGALAHHQTLRATIDCSFQLLTEPEQQLLGRLAVFAGGATLEAAETVCSREGLESDAVFELLASLVARSLVVAEEHGPDSRYRLLETIRQYSQERLYESGEPERWRARHADYYASLLPRIRHQAHDPDVEVFWAVRLSADQDNLLTAWSWAIDTGNVDIAFRMLAGFAPSEIWTSYPLLLGGEAALELLGAAGHPRYPLARAVSAVFASIRTDVSGAEELCIRAAVANARKVTPGLEGRGGRQRRPLKYRDYNWRVRRRWPADGLRPPHDRGRACRPGQMPPRSSRGAAEAYLVESPKSARLISSIVAEALGEEPERELRARGAHMHWDQALAYTLTQITQALNEPQSETHQ